MKNNNALVIFIFLMFNVLSFVDVFFINLRVGLLSSIFIVVFIVVNSKYLYLLGKNKNLIFMIYIIVSILSVFGYLINDRPLELYFKAINYNLLPSMLYIMGMVSVRKEDNVLSLIVYSNSIILFIGLLIYFLFPEFYWEKYYAAGGSLLRFGSYIGSIQVGSIAVVNIPLIFSNKLKIHLKIKLVLLIISIISIILCAQRSTYINLVIVTILLLTVSFKIKSKLNLFRTVRVAIVLIISGILVFQIFDNFIGEQLKNYFLMRIMSIDDGMITDRSGQWIVAINYFLKFPYGMGLGAGGDKASALGMLLIPDGSYLRILVETGLFGISSFIGINIIAIMNKKASIYHKIALTTYLLAAIGNNVFDLYYSSFIYWILLGYIVNEENDSISS